MPEMPEPPAGLRVVVIGVGADGLDGLAPATAERVRAAAVVIGGERHLAMLPGSNENASNENASNETASRKTSGDQIRRAWPSPLREGLPDLFNELPSELPSTTEIVALASGDPLVSGVATTLIDVLGSDAVEVVPHPSSFALARARLGWPAETVTELSVVGRDPRLVLPHLGEGRRLLVLTSGAQTPSELGALLSERGHGDSIFTVLGNLGADTESRNVTTAASVGEAPALHVLAIEVRGAGLGSLVAGLPDDAFETDGQITRRDLRISALARLAPQPGQLLWDVGAGSGAVGIEWARAHPTCRTVAIEPRADRAERVGRNAATLGVPGLTVVVGAAPEALADLPSPDAIFVGGGATVAGVLDRCVMALKPGGRLVVHAVTLETEAALAARAAEIGGELTRLHVETALPLGGFTGWQPTRAVTQWAWTRPEETA